MKTSIFKVLGLLCVLSVISVSEVFSANNISVMVVETNIAEEVVNQHASIWESGIMDVFFAGGYIVSNARSLRIKHQSRPDFPNEALFDFQDAIENGSDYFVLATLDYRPAEDGKSPPLLNTASLKLFQITPYRFVVEKKIQVEQVKNNPGGKKEEWASANNVAKTLLPYLGAGILSLGGGEGAGHAAD